MYRNTVQRQIILDTLIKLNTHPSIEEIYIEIQKAHPSISRTTVYRNLRQLAENKLIRKVTLPDGLERYDGRNFHHYHFKCKNCEKIFDVDMEYIEKINNTVQERYGFLIYEHEILFNGLCVKCVGKRKK